MSLLSRLPRHAALAAAWAALGWWAGQACLGLTAPAQAGVRLLATPVVPAAVPTTAAALPAPTAPTAPTAASACADARPALPPPPQAHGLSAQADERLAGLLAARHDALALPDELLQRLMLTDPSEHVRLAALETRLQREPQQPAQAQAWLQQALASDSPALQREARQRLDELQRLHQLRGAADHGGP
jgi:hypothetical protein